MIRREVTDMADGARKLVANFRYSKERKQSAYRAVDFVPGICIKPVTAG